VAGPYHEKALRACELLDIDIAELVTK